MWGEKIKGAGILLVMSKALFYFPARSCLLFYVISKKKKWCWIDVLLFLPFFPLIYFLEEIWDDMACDSAFLLVIHWGL